VVVSDALLEGVGNPGHRAVVFFEKLSEEIAGALCQPPDLGFITLAQFRHQGLFGNVG